MTTVDIPGQFLLLLNPGYQDSSHFPGGINAVNTVDGDTTYVLTEMGAETSASGYRIEVSFPAATIPGTLVSTSFVTVSRGTDGRTGNSATVGLDLTFMMPDLRIIKRDSGGIATDDQHWYGLRNNGTTEYEEYVTPLTIDGVEYVTQEMIEAGTVEAFPGEGISINEVIFAGGGQPTSVPFATFWTYIALRVTYTGGPVTRQSPRDDGRGLSTGPRLVPPPKSRRLVGGHQ